MVLYLCDDLELSSRLMEYIGFCGTSSQCLITGSFIVLEGVDWSMVFIYRG
jgi:hypothetical protein